MPFLARLLLSLSCAAALLSPATAADMVAVAAVDGPALHCQHEGAVAHTDHADHTGHEAGVVAQDLGCNDCGACGSCASHCIPVLISATGPLLPTWGSVQAGVPPVLLAGIAGAPELKPPRL
jgi:hypothetical protein